jgi:hypothetical protein
MLCIRCPDGEKLISIVREGCILCRVDPISFQALEDSTCHVAPYPANTSFQALEDSTCHVAPYPANTSFQALEDSDLPRGTISGQHELSAHSQRHLSKVLLKSRLNAITHEPGSKEETVVLPLARTHTSITSLGKRPGRGRDLHGHPIGPAVHIVQRGVAHQRAATPRPTSGQLPRPTSCPHGCRHPQTNERVNVRYG